MIEKELLDILACPVCKGNVELKGDKIVCYRCQKYYPIQDDIPLMLVERAKPLERDKHDQFLPHPSQSR